MKRYCDSLVIGGGIIGLSCGYYLSREGFKVQVIDSMEFGSGSSGACDDMILLQSKKPGVVLELAMESLEMYRFLHMELGCDLGFKQMGGMILIENQEELAVMEEFVSSQRSCGLNVDIVDREELRRRQPHVSDRFISSTYSPDDSQVDPFLVMKGFINAGQRLGMEVRYREAAVTAEKNGAGRWQVLTSTGCIVEAENVVISAGAWSNIVGGLFDISIPIFPRRGQLLITEKIPPIGETNLWSASYMVTKLRPDLAKVRENQSEYNELGLGFSFTRTAHGNYLIGSTREEQAGFKKLVDYRALEALSRQVAHIIPLMRHVHIIRHIAGFRPATPDGKMILGPWPGKEGLYVASGHEGDGIAMAPITGKLLSDIFTGRKSITNMKELIPRCMVV